MTTLDLTGKTALVTGGSRGIGRAICRMLAASGARVMVHYNRGEEGARETLSSLEGEGHFIAYADLSLPEECEQLINETLYAFGALDLLVNNAGIYEHLRFDEADYETWQTRWRQMLDVNLMSAVNLSYLFVRENLGRGSGKVINIASRAGFKGERQASHYGASKAAMINLTRSMANELAQTGLLVYGVAPGWVETEMTTEHLARDGERILSDVPLKRVAQPEDVANAVLFLASERADYLNGFVLDVNGGSYFH